jgi:outer membrane protein insertion porin family/translocation and assembly module TamA
VGVFARRRSVPGIVVDHGWGANASLTRTLDERVPVSLTYRFERTRVEAGQVYFCASFGVCRPETADAIAAAHHLSPLGLETHAELVDDALAPTRGLTARLALEHASSLTGSDFRYNRVAGELAYYWPVGRSTLAARVRGGWVRPLAGTFDALDLDDGGPGLLHPRKRFYAGGTNSVRGYAENQLGPRVLIVDPALLLEPADTTAVACTPATLESGTCDPGFVSSSEFRPRPLGGEALLEGGLELRFPLLPSMLGAVFVDAGHVVATDGSLAPSSSAITPGVGIRYQSPLGPIRVDLGVRPGLVQDLPVITQVGEGSEARLVVLDTRKRYDPLEGSGGFIRAFLSRLQLHLAIGEAF